MTKREREQIKKAIRYIHSDEGSGGDYHKGMDILCRLAGLEARGDAVQQSVMPADLGQVLRKIHKTHTPDGQER